MRRTAPAFALLCLALLLSPTAHADEGMYLLYEANRLNLSALKKRGLRLSVKQLQGLAPAITQMNRGGTGSFVSAQGLVVTNHHVAYGCLARLDATTHKGIMNKGHVAKSRATEVPCPGYDMLAVLEVKDVTAQVLKVVKKRMSPERRARAIRIRTRTIEGDCEKTPGRVCEVRALNGGAGFVLSAYKRIRDMRIVYAPPKDLGKYGGDIDNWRYPRHTADFTFLRAYVSPSGAGVPHNKANVPYKPKAFLKVAQSGVRRGQLNMVLGFPGRTMRHATHARAKFFSDHVLARRAQLFSELLKVLPKTGAAARKYQGLESGLNNAMKYYSDSIKQFGRFKLLDRKARQMAALKKRIEADPALKKKHGKLLSRIQGIYKKLATQSEKIQLLRYIAYLTKSLRTAVDIVRWSKQRLVSDMAREGERYRDKNIYRVYRASRFLEKLTAVAGEKALLLKLLELAQKLPKRQQLGAVKWLARYGKRELAKLRRQAKRKKTTVEALYTKELRISKVPTSPLAVGLDFVYGRTRLYGSTDIASKSKALWQRTRLLHPTDLGSCAPEHGRSGANGDWCSAKLGRLKAKLPALEKEVKGFEVTIKKLGKTPADKRRRRVLSRQLNNARKELAQVRAEITDPPTKDRLQNLAKAANRLDVEANILRASLVKLKATAKTRKRLQRKIRQIERKIRATRKRLSRAIAGAVRRSKDPLLQLARRLVADDDRMDRGPLRPLEKMLAPILRPQLVKEVIQPRYWDANFTLRLSYGTVSDYTESKTQKRWRYLSRLTWLVKKGRGRYPFFVEPKLKSVHARRDFGRWVDRVIKDVPVNFTTTLDTTGGNSGSPVLNGKGELIGLLFDGTPESILSDWQYLEKQQRSICVDIRFALFLADKVHGARYVLKELGL